MDFIEIKKQLRDLGWDYNEDLRCYFNGNRYVEVADIPFIDIYTWNDGSKDASYLTIEEFILFSKIFEKKEKNTQNDLVEVLDILKRYAVNDGWSNGWTIKFWEMNNKELKKVNEVLRNEKQCNN